MVDQTYLTKSALNTDQDARNDESRAFKLDSLLNCVRRNKYDIRKMGPVRFTKPRSLIKNF